MNVENISLYEECALNTKPFSEPIRNKSGFMRFNIPNVRTRILIDKEGFDYFLEYAKNIGLLGYDHTSAWIADKKTIQYRRINPEAEKFLQKNYGWKPNSSAPYLLDPANISIGDIILLADETILKVKHISIMNGEYPLEINHKRFNLFGKSYNSVDAIMIL